MTTTETAVTLLFGMTPEEVAKMRAQVDVFGAALWDIAMGVDDRILTQDEMRVCAYDALNALKAYAALKERERAQGGGVMASNYVVIKELDAMLERQQARIAELEVDVERLRATILNLQAMAERGFPIDATKLAARCQAALKERE